MADNSSQSSTINTSQPTVLKGLRLGTHAVETVSVEHPNEEGEIMTINKADYDEGVHGPIVKPKLQKKKKKVSADNGNGNGNGKKKKKKKKADD